MKIRFGILASSAAAAVLSLGLPAFGQSTFWITTTDSAPVVTVDNIGVFAGVYGGGATSSSNNPIICDDFNNEIGVPSSWQASGYQASTINAGNISELLFGGANVNAPPNPPGFPNIGLTGYAEIAYLVNQEFASNDPNTQATISEAIWAISDPTVLGAGGSDPVPAAALAYVTAAANYVGTNGDSMSQYSNLWIYTPNPVNDQTNNGQEMWTEVPEGGATLLYLLLAGAALFGAMRFKSRNQLTA